MEKGRSVITATINDKIHTLRGVQIIIDRDLAGLYDVETRVLKQAVNRNKSRFPEDFMFILTESEIDIMVSQNVIPSKKYLGGALPYAFTEQGVANLSTVLNNERAIQINIHIMRAFVELRKFLSKNADIFMRLDNVERKQIAYDQNFEKVFKAIEDKQLIPKQGIFFNGQIFDAYKFASDLIKSANESIVLIDNYIDESTLTLFSNKNKGVKTTIYTNNVSEALLLLERKFNQQYKNLEIKEFHDSHDRFIIIDNKEVYHIGASLKDLGKKWFGFSKFEMHALTIIEKLRN
jgi:hypothetical protein